MNITNINQLDFQKEYSLKDYFTWNFSDRIELLKGYISKMSPAPSSMHQKITNRLSTKFEIFFENQPCQVFQAPYDVYLNEQNTVVQPDVCVVCDIEKIKPNGCEGAPDLVIEVLSPGNSKVEMKDKYEIYQKAGVKEYWVVFPIEKILQVFILSNGKFQALPPNVLGDIVNTSLWSEIEINLEALFKNPFNFS